MRGQGSCSHIAFKNAPRPISFVEVSSLMQRYSDLPMPLADGCLVRMSELRAESVVLTLDSDSSIYRRFKRQRIPLLMPTP